MIAIAVPTSSKNLLENETAIQEGTRPDSSASEFRRDQGADIRNKLV
jgi:hypothetical protein